MEQPRGRETTDRELRDFSLYRTLSPECEARECELRYAIERRKLRLDYEHAKATHEASTKPRPGPRQGARYTFQKHWISTGVASIAKGGRPRLHLFAGAPPSAPAEPGSVHLRVGVTLTPAKGKHPTRSAWALEAHDIGPGGTQKERLRARGAIATAATHPAHAKGTVAKRHTWQVAMQVAAEKALHYAAQLRSKGRNVTISLPSATTARDLQPTRQGETRPRTSHRHIASRNSLKLQQLGAQVRINVDTSAAPPRLQQDAEDAARSGSLQTHVCVPGHADIAISLWDELRTWDPGD